MDRGAATSVGTDGNDVAKTHALSCLNDGCDHIALVVAGELPTRCPKCYQDGKWQIDRIMIWSLDDLRLLKRIAISPE
jgi:hypothetical protein